MLLQSPRNIKPLVGRRYATGTTFLRSKKPTFGIAGEELLAYLIHVMFFSSL